MLLRQITTVTVPHPPSDDDMADDLSPSAPDARLFRMTSRANTLYHAQDYASAASEYTRALDYLKPAKRLTNATDFTALLFGNRSACWCMLRKWGDALRDAELAVRIRPSWAKGHYRKGEALYGLRNYEEALKCYEDASRMDPENADYRVGLAQASIKLSDLERGFDIHQLLAGRDFASEKSFIWLIRNQIFDFAIQMRNFVYVIADTTTKECFIVDACWDVPGILAYLEQHHLIPVGAIITHSHFDHVGGTPPPPYDQLRIKVTGVATLVKKFPNLKVYIHPEDVPVLLSESNPGLPQDRIVRTPDNHEVVFGAGTSMRFLHTPGHTPGSQCILVGGDRIFTGDTLFLGCCGRMDLPGGDMEAMWRSLNRLRELDEEVVVYPGHAYGGGEWTTVGEEKLGGGLKEISLAQWRRKMREHGMDEPSSGSEDDDCEECRRNRQRVEEG